MRRIRLVSVPSAFIAGVLCASALAAIPAIADIVPGDQNPTAFDATPPLLTVQPAEFVIGELLGWVNFCGEDAETYVVTPMRLRWDATDATSGVKTYRVFHYTSQYGLYSSPEDIQVGSVAWAGANIVGDCGTGLEDDDYAWVGATDFRGASSSSPAINNHLDVWDETGVPGDGVRVDPPTVTRTGTWSTSRCECAFMRATTYTSARGASISYTLTLAQGGRMFAVVAPRGSTRGVMNISVDGGPATAVNTYRAGANANRVVVWQRALDAGTHTIRIVNAATAGHPRIDVDAVLLGPAWGEHVIDPQDWFDY